MEVDFYLRETYPLRWSRVLRHLKLESGLKLFDEKFDQWLFDIWQIKIHYAPDNGSRAWVGMSMPDETYSMIILKYGNTNDN